MGAHRRGGIKIVRAKHASEVACACTRDKAKLEAVETGITEFEDEFLAHIVLPNGQTMGEFAKPQIAHAYDTGDMPPLLGHDK